MVSGAVAREPTDSGVRLRFPRDLGVAELAALVDEEQQCCSFLSFNIEVDSLGLTLEVRGPAEAREIVQGLIQA
jgi:hypothetical protein